MERVNHEKQVLRVQIDIGAAYGTDINLMRQVIAETVRGVEGVPPDKPVDVFFLAFGDSTRRFGCGGGLRPSTIKNRLPDRVKEAIERTLDEAGIDVPNPAYDLNLKMEGERSRGRLQEITAWCGRGLTSLSSLARGDGFAVDCRAQVLGKEEKR